MIGSTLVDALPVAGSVVAVLLAVRYILVLRTVASYLRVAAGVLAVLAVAVGAGVVDVHFGRLAALALWLLEHGRAIVDGIMGAL